MSRKPSKVAALQRPARRQGDGVPLDLNPEQIGEVDGGVVKSYSISLSGAPVPDRRYVADVATLSFKDETFKLIFGQETLTGSGFRSLLVIHMSQEALQQFYFSLKSMHTPSLEEIAQSLKISKTLLADVHDIREPEQTVAFASNIVGSAIHGTESCLDFYQASAFSFADAPHANKIGVDPVVRVDLRTSLLIALYQAMSDFSLDIPSLFEENK